MTPLERAMKLEEQFSQSYPTSVAQGAQSQQQQTLAQQLFEERENESDEETSASGQAPSPPAPEPETPTEPEPAPPPEEPPPPPSEGV